MFKVRESYHLLDLYSGFGRMASLALEASAELGVPTDYWTVIGAEADKKHAKRFMELVPGGTFEAGEVHSVAIRSWYEQESLDLCVICWGLGYCVSKKKQVQLLLAIHDLLTLNGAVVIFENLLLDSSDAAVV